MQIFDEVIILNDTELFIKDEKGHVVKVIDNDNAMYMINIMSKYILHILQKLKDYIMLICNQIEEKLILKMK